MADARGHGNSSTPPDGYRYADHASDVIGLIERLGLRVERIPGAGHGVPYDQPERVAAAVGSFLLVAP